jgi:uncharacterized protein (TIGR03086 family)
MSETADRYQRVAQGFADRVSGIGPDQWDAPTPCPDWRVRDLVGHVVSTHRRVLASAEGTEAQEADVNGDLPAQWKEATAAIAAALDDPARAGATIKSGPFGEQPFEQLVGRLLCADTLTHTWDLARATGQDETLDADAVAKAHEFLTPLDENIRRPGGFAPKVEPAPGADAQTAFLNFAGRQP